MTIVGTALRVRGQGSEPFSLRVSSLQHCKHCKVIGLCAKLQTCNARAGGDREVRGQRSIVRGQRSDVRIGQQRARQSVCACEIRKAQRNPSARQASTWRRLASGSGAQVAHRPHGPLVISQLIKRVLTRCCVERPRDHVRKTWSSWSELLRVHRDFAYLESGVGSLRPGVSCVDAAWQRLPP
jgi:hypothetical protein